MFGLFFKSSCLFNANLDGELLDEPGLRLIPNLPVVCFTGVLLPPPVKDDTAPFPIFLASFLTPGLSNTKPVAAAILPAGPNFEAI